MSSKEPQNESAALPLDGATPPSETRDLAMLALHKEEARVPSLAKPEYAELRRDVERRGVLEPLAITPSGVVLDGRARLQAARDLGHDRIAVRQVAVEDDLAYMLRAAITPLVCVGAGSRPSATDVFETDVWADGHERQLRIEERELEAG